MDPKTPGFVKKGVGLSTVILQHRFHQNFANSDKILPMLERNPCVASGCPGLCCQNIDLEIRNDERKRIFPGAVHIDTLDALGWVKEQKVNGVFYTRYRKARLKSGKYSVIAINGPCPNREPNGNCSVHKDREAAAWNFQIGSSECNEIRKEHGLAPIFIEPVE